VDILKRLYRISKAYAGAAINRLHGKGYDETAEAYKNNNIHQDNTGYVFQHYGKSIDPVLAEYYANLELPYGAELDMVRASWKRLLKKYHPDIHSTDPEKKRIATLLTQKLNEAYRAIEKAKKEDKV
jgi:DnaJ-domain-containing protein 1